MWRVCRKATGPMDCSNATLIDADLSHVNFEGCDLTNTTLCERTYLVHTCHKPEQLGSDKWVDTAWWRVASISADVLKELEAHSYPERQPQFARSTVVEYRTALARLVVKSSPE